MEFYFPKFPYISAESSHVFTRTYEPGGGAAQAIYIKLSEKQFSVEELPKFHRYHSKYAVIEYKKDSYKYLLFDVDPALVELRRKRFTIFIVKSYSIFSWREGEVVDISVEKLPLTVNVNLTPKEADNFLEGILEEQILEAKKVAKKKDSKKKNELAKSLETRITMLKDWRINGIDRGLVPSLADSAPREVIKNDNLELTYLNYIHAYEKKTDPKAIVIKIPYFRIYKDESNGDELPYSLWIKTSVDQLQIPSKTTTINPSQYALSKSNEWPNMLDPAEWEELD